MVPRGEEAEMARRPGTGLCVLLALALVAGLAVAACDGDGGGGEGGGPDGRAVFDPTPEVAAPADAGDPADGATAGDLLGDAPLVDAPVPMDSFVDVPPLPDAAALPDTPADLAPLDTLPPPDAAPDVAPDTGAPVEVGAAGQFSRTAVVDGVQRTWQLHVPQSAVDAMASGPAPLLLAFHGAGDGGANFILATDLTGAASGNGFVLAAPDGYNAGWYVQVQEGWAMADGNDTSLQNDASLALRIVEEASQDYWIDPGRIYAAGHSRGGGLVGLLAMLSGGLGLSAGTWVSPFAAYGVNAGYDAAGGQIPLTQATPKRPVWVIHGTADEGVPYDYGAAFAAALDAAGWDVTFTPVPGGPHTWLWRPQYGQTNQDLWDFFLSNATD
jgi:poly(3-hydroxybutyrate) depolymerase